jgi:hypothetical protein
MIARRIVLGLAVLTASYAAQAQAQIQSQVSADDLAQIQALFQRQAADETAHDIAALESVLAPVAPDGTDPVAFLSRAGQFWGRAAVLAHFQSNFTGTWRFIPDQQLLRITPLNADTALLYDPTDVTIGKAGEAPLTARFLINEIAVRTPAGWRISAIVPVPAK